MRRFVVGCFGALLLIAVLAGALGYVYLVKPAREHLATLRQLTSLAGLEQEIRNRTPFEPPASGELSPELVARFAEVQRSVQRALGEGFTRLGERYRDLEGKAASSGRIAMADLAAASRDLVAAAADAKRAQVEALNDAGWSMAEYEWVERRIYEAAGLVVSSLDLDAIERALAGGRADVPLTPHPPEAVPDRNRDLVAPYLDKLEEWLPLAWIRF